MRLYHEPTGAICACGAYDYQHKPVKRPEHVPQGDPCEKCGAPAAKHRVTPKRKDLRVHRERSTYKKVKPEKYCIGIDGEGIGRKPHKYIYLAASDFNGKTWEVENIEGLTTSECLDFILSLPNATIAGYGFNYDLTKMLTDLPNDTLYRLFHEKERLKVNKKGRKHYKRVKWNGFRLNYMNRKLTIKKGETTRVVWDIIGFYQQSFVNALIAWSIAPKDHLTQMQAMKEKRSEFKAEDFDGIKAYCKEECRYLALLLRALIRAHNDAGLALRDFFGAGSTASALLKKMNIKEYYGHYPEEMKEPIASAFFGGRFENAVIGPIEGTIYNYDISSAYPYHITHLPCLACGSWRLQKNPTEDDIQASTLALVRYAMHSCEPGPWGPFPVRTKDGHIIYPWQSPGGWVWGKEFIAAQELCYHVYSKQAWLYNTDCEHQPFELIPQLYLERIKIGKEGKGIVFKLGPNSVYGKLAQSKGHKPPFQNYIWAGVITSNTRAQLLNAITRCPESVLMLATDGIFSTEQLSLPRPRDTGTFGVSKPLGGWEETIFTNGMFAARPGIYFPLMPTENQLKQVRARGLGKKIIQQQWHRMVEAFANGEESITIDGMTQFLGAKGCLTKSQAGINRSPNYGEWLPQSIVVTFNPLPKRNRGKGGKLDVVEYWPEESVPYNPAMAIEVDAFIEESEDDEQDDRDSLV